MRLVTFDDIITIYAKARQRGLQFLLSKLNFRKLARTRSAFDASGKHHSNWWMIPMVLMLLLFGLLIVFTHGTAVAPFIYTLF